MFQSYFALPQIQINLQIQKTEVEKLQRQLQVSMSWHHCFILSYLQLGLLELVIFSWIYKLTLKYAQLDFWSTYLTATLDTYLGSLWSCGMWYVVYWCRYMMSTTRQPDNEQYKWQQSNDNKTYILRLSRSTLWKHVYNLNNLLYIWTQRKGCRRHTYMHNHKRACKHNRSTTQSHAQQINCVCFATDLKACINNKKLSTLTSILSLKNSWGASVP